MSDHLVTLEPDDSGSAGTQERGTPAIASIQLGPALEGLPMLQAMAGLAATRSRALGGEIAAGLLVGAFQQTAKDCQDLKRELNATRDRLEQRSQALADSQTEVAVLRVRLAEGSSERHIRNLLITVGTFLIGLGIDTYRSRGYTGAIVFCGLGATLVLVGWFAQPGRAPR
jgi:hypothetical protein